MNAQHIYRWNQRLQAGVSVLSCPEPTVRGGICDADFSFCYIVSGDGCYLDENGRSFRYGPGLLLLRLPGVAHSQTHEPGTAYIDCFLVLPKEFADLLTERALCSPERPVIELGERAGLPGEFAALTEQLAEAPEERLIAVAAEFFSFVCDLLLRAGVDDPRRAAVMIAAERLAADEEVPVSRIAAECGMSHATLRRRFTEFLGMSPVEYRIRRRIERIQSLLRTTDLSQKELASRDDRSVAEGARLPLRLRRCLHLQPPVSTLHRSDARRIPSPLTGIAEKNGEILCGALAMLSFLV